MNNVRCPLAIAVAVAAVFAGSCSNAPGTIPASSGEPRESNDSELVILPTTTKGIIRGFVRDVDTNDPLQYANVLIVGTATGAMSVKTGEFAISGVVPGVYQVRAMMMNYKAATVDSVVVNAGKETHVSFRLAVRMPTYEEHR